MVEQLGLAIIPWCPRAAAGFTSGTTRGTSGSMRKALELSTTTAPARAASGAKRRDMPPPAEKSAMSMPEKESSSRTCTGMLSPLKSKALPRERSLASRVSPAAGNSRCSSTFIISCPTMPVAPTMATRGSTISCSSLSPRPLTAVHPYLNAPVAGGKAPQS